MSRKRAGRKETTRKERKRPEPSRASGRSDRPGKSSSWFRTFLIAAPAALLSAILFLQLDSPRSMLGAIRRLEYETIDTATRLNAPRATTWEDVFTARNRAIIGHADKDAHDALERLLKLVIDAEHHRIEPAAAVGQGAAYLRLNHDNLVSRLAYATLVDIQTTRNSASNITAADRLKAMRDVIEADPPPTRITLHNAAFRAAWHETLKRFFDRPDVAASLAPVFYPYEIRNHTEALPIIQRRLLDLAEALKRRGRSRDSYDCLRWTARGLLGLMVSETDAAARLLCADLLGRCVMPDSQAARSLRGFRTDYHAAVLRADVDLADQAFTRKRSVAPGAYRSAISLLVAGIVPAAIGIGAVCALATACLSAPLMRIFRRAEKVDRPPPWSLLTRWLLILIPTILLTILIPARFHLHGPFSTYWLLALVLSTTAVGFLIALVCAGHRPAPGTDGRWVRRMLLLIVTTVVILLPALSPRTITPVLRHLDLSIGGSWMMVLACVTVMVAVTIAIRPRPRDFAAGAARVWCINIALAFGLYQAHRIADAKYQAASVEGHRDEVAARLGADWQAQYLTPIYDAFEIQSP